MAAEKQIFSGGFDQPVFQSQAVFRTLMDCMARPGTIGRIEDVVRPVGLLGDAAGAVVLTLCDHDTLVWLTPALARSGMPAWLAFHTGASTTEDRQAAHFAFIEKGAGVPALNLFAQGTQEYPDRSTTLVIELDSLEGGEPLVLTGPGIKDETLINPKTLPDAFLTFWSANRQNFPRGVDLILIAGRDVMCLPRTVAIRQREA